ncbi:PfkB family carbohydrate kinase [Acidimangrovimonas pyrenivorans]|uniref:pyridoxal kinase n=1 Tax=Acidimangrovimonas pyrenivorans TaxID=2030798 RepID=A0ABV7ANB4_9RHOB
MLILSSWVAHGHVGLSAAAPALQLLGHQVTQLPTILLSNHPGWPHVSGSPVPVAQLAAMLEALAVNGWLAAQDAVLTGYLPTAAHVEFAVDLVRRLRALETPPRVVVDPVLGDNPKGLYVPRAVATALRDRLVPEADILTPNAFELGWLSAAPTDTLDDAAEAGRRLSGRCRVLMTSAPVAPDGIGVLELDHDAPRLWAAPRRAGVPHGVGDVFSALIAAGLSTGAALGHLDALIAASLDAPHLRIAEAAPRWTAAAPLCPRPRRDTEET